MMAGDPNGSIAERLLQMELQPPASAKQDEKPPNGADETVAAAAAEAADDGANKDLQREAGQEAGEDADEQLGCAQDESEEDENKEEEEEEDAEGCAADEPEDLDELIEQLTSDNRRTRQFAVQSLRRRVSDSYEAPAYARLLASPAMPALVSCLDDDANPELQFEAAWALTNLLAGSGAQPTNLVATSGLARPLVRLFRSAGTVRLREQACWALANVAGESPAWRDQLLASGDLLVGLLELWQSEPNNSLLDASSLLAVNLFREREPRIRFETAQRLLPPMVRLLRHPYEAVVPHLVWALSYAVDECEPRARLLLREPDVLPRLAELLDSRDDGLLLPTLRLLCGLSSCLDCLPAEMLSPGGIIDSVGQLLGHHDAKVRRQALLFFGNVSSGPEPQLEAAARAGCLAGVGRILKAPATTPAAAAAAAAAVSSAASDAMDLERREAFWIVPNFLLSRGHRFSKQIIDECLEGLLESLTMHESEVTRCSLLCLRHLLFAARYKNRDDLNFDSLKAKIEAVGGVRKIELAQKTDDKELVKLSYHIVDQFFWGNEKKYMEDEKDGSLDTSPSPLAATADCQIGDDHHDNGSEPERPSAAACPDKETLTSLIGGLQARD